MIAQTHHGRIIVVVTATVGAAAVAGRQSRAGLIVSRRLLARGLLTGLLEAGLLLVQPRLFSAGLARRARGTGGTILAGSAGLPGFTDFTGLLVNRCFCAGEALGPCG